MFGAVLNGLGIDGRRDEAVELFTAFEANDSTGENIPGVTCHDALVMAHVRAKAWDDAIAVHESMKRKHISESRQTIHGLVLAHNHRGGKSSVMSLLETLQSENASIDETTFKMLIRIMVPELHGTTDEIRSKVRKVGELDPNLRDASLNLIRSVRRAEIEQSRPMLHDQPRDSDEHAMEAWRAVLPHFLEFVRLSSAP